MSTLFYASMTSRVVGAIGLQTALHHFEVAGASTTKEAFAACVDWILSQGRENATPEFIYEGTWEDAKNEARMRGRTWPPREWLVRLEITD